MKFQPTEDRVLVRRKDEKTETEGGIVIPDQAREKPQEGEIIAVGPSDTDHLGVGDKVLFSKYAGTEIELDDEKFLIINAFDILGILTDE